MEGGEKKRLINTTLVSAPIIFDNNNVIDLYLVLQSQQPCLPLPPLWLRVVSLQTTTKVTACKSGPPLISI